MNYAAILLTILFAYTYNSSAPDAVNVQQWPDFVEPVKPSPLGAEVTHYAKGNLHAPETNIITPSGFYSLCEDGTIRSVSATGETSVSVNVGGRPLGGAYAPSESTKNVDVLYIAEVSKGLIRIEVSLIKPPKPPKIELVSYLVTESSEPILYADDVAIGPSGLVYFSDASDLPVPLKKGSKVKRDTLGTSIQDGIRGKRSGKVLR